MIINSNIQLLDQPSEQKSSIILNPSKKFYIYKKELEQDGVAERNRRT